jgi:hypothetical protein
MGLSGSSTLQGLLVREVQYLLLVVCEVAWIYPWTVAGRTWLFRMNGPILDLPSVVVILMLALVLARLAALLAPLFGGRKRTALDGKVPQPLWRRVVDSLVVQSVVALGIVLAGLLGLGEIPPLVRGQGASAVFAEFFSGSAGLGTAQVAGLVCILWWRGLRLGRARPNLAVAVDEFVVGLVAVSVLLAFAPLASQVFPTSTDLLALSGLTFVATGLAGMPLARLVDVSQRPSYGSEGGLAAGGCWLVMLSGLMGGLVVSALFAAQLLTFERILGVWNQVKDPLTYLALSAIDILSRPVELLARLIGFLLSLIPHAPNVRPPASPAPDLFGSAQPGDEPAISPELIMALKVGLVVILALVLIFLLMKAVSGLGVRWKREDIEEARDSVWTWPSLKAAWQWLFRRWRPVGERMAAMVAAGHVRRTQVRTVRGLYREFLTVAAGLGHGRHRPETPLEYESRLAEASLPGREEVRTITEAYVLDRYAAPISKRGDPRYLAAAVDRLRTLWQDAERR